jgi:hypothetical protein
MSSYLGGLPAEDIEKVSGALSVFIAFSSLPIAILVVEFVKHYVYPQFV